MGYDGGMKSSSNCSEVSSGTLESSSGSAEFSSYSYETTEISENYDDCAINESDYSGIQENSDEPTENYDDCELSAEDYEPEESVSTEDVDDYSDCAKETYYQEELENKSIEEQSGDSDFESSFRDAIKSNEVQSEIAEDSSENIKEDIEKETDSEITDKQQEKIEVETKKQLEGEYENSEISDEEVQEIENDKTDEEIENIEEQEQSINDEIDDSVEENEKQMEEDKVKEQAEKDAYETVRDSELTDEQKTELVENKEEQIKEKIEDEQEELPENDENLDCVDVESLDEDTKVEVENLDSEDIVQESINDVEDNTDTEITDETKDEINEKFNKEINAQLEDEKITVDELKELEEYEIEEKTEQIEECSEAVDAEIEKSVEDAVESENLSETEIKESVEEDVVEVIDDEKLSNEQVEEIIDEKEEKIENTIEAEQMEQASEEKIEEAAEEIEENKEGKESKDLSKRIDDLLSKDNVTSSEVKELSDENSESLNNALQEQIQLETEAKNKFNEALKLDRGTEEYKTTLQEYNALKDQKLKVDEDVKQLKNQQDILDKKSLELRNAQIEKGEMAVDELKITVESFKSELYDEVKYLDKMRNSAEYALAYTSERKEDWDVVRGRLSDEYLSISKSLKDIASEKQLEYEKLKIEYFNVLSAEDNLENVTRISELSDKGRELNSEIESINSRANYADEMSNELSKNLNPIKRTSYKGVGGKSFTYIHKNMIQQQGYAVEDFKGTCGDCSIANTLNALGDSKTEAEVVQRARDLNACTDKKISPFLPENIKEKIRAINGGTSVVGRTEILKSFGYDCENRSNQSLLDISQQIESGKGAIINVDHRVLNKQREVSTLNPTGTDHALTVTGVEKDAMGNPVGLWIHDTGVCSDMGNAFYCNSKDYDVWQKTPNCTVQYVFKNEKGYNYDNKRINE